MPIQRIDHAGKKMHGYQARAVVQGRLVLTEFVSDKASGGFRPAWDAAMESERRLQREAAIIRRRLPLIERHLARA